MTATTSTYALSNDWELAERRLRLLEHCHDPGTITLATALGTAPGWRCLEAGAGAGSIARWMARRVGAFGSVLAVDVDTRLLDDAAAPNLEVRRMDLVTDYLPAGGFDLVHARLVLMHVAERDHVLRRLVAAVRPGGVLLLEDYDYTALLATTTGAVRDLSEAMLSFLEAAGGVTDCGRTLPAGLDRYGLVDVEARVDLPLVRGGSPTAELVSLTALQQRGPVIARGLDPARFDAGRDELADPSRWFYGPAMVAAWGRRP